MIILSENLKNLLTEIKSNKIAEKILEIANDSSTKTMSNYLDIEATSNGNITFILNSKIKTIDKDPYEYITYSRGSHLRMSSSHNRTIFFLLEFDPNNYGPITHGNIYKVIRKEKSPLTSNIYALLEIDVDSNKKYNVINISHTDPVNKEYFYWNKYRQSAKVGRFIKMLMNKNNIEFTDSEYEKFVNEYKAHHDKNYGIFSQFEIVNGNNIPHFYHKRNYVEVSKDNTLYNSCMCTVNSRYFNIYASNPSVSMIILKDSNDNEKITGRAILWTLDSGEKLMDRVYTINDSDINLFKMFAKEKGFCQKEYNDNSSDLNMVHPDGTIEYDKIVQLTLEKYDLDYYPYMDTFKYLDMETGILTNKYSQNISKLESTDGGYYNT